MGKIAHRVSIALGFAVACLHALCGAGKAEAKAYAASDDAFLPGVSRSADISARVETTRKTGAKKRLERESDYPSKEFILYCAPDVDFWTDFSFLRVRGNDFNAGSKIVGAVCVKIRPEVCGRSNPIRGPTVPQGLGDAFSGGARL